MTKQKFLIQFRKARITANKKSHGFLYDKLLDKGVNTGELCLIDRHFYDGDDYAPCFNRLADYFLSKNNLRLGDVPYRYNKFRFRELNFFRSREAK